MSLSLTPAIPTDIGTVTAESAVALNPVVVTEFWAYPSAPATYPSDFYPSQAGLLILTEATMTPGSVSTVSRSSTSQSLPAASPGVLVAPGASQGDLGSLSAETSGSLLLTPR